jgi:L,D-peptidoglycan transpeptidase YkuD (ErfK/YbiS/YcfS/YnhG family)
MKVDQCPFDESVSENLWKSGRVYEYALVMGVNQQGTPGTVIAFC